MFAWKQNQGPSTPFVVTDFESVPVLCNCDPCTAWYIGAVCSCGCGSSPCTLGMASNVYRQGVEIYGLFTGNSQYFNGVEVGCRFNGLRHTTPEAPFTGTVSAQFYKISPDQSRSLLAEWSGECEAGVPCVIGEGNTFDYGTPWSGEAFDWVYFTTAGCYAIDTVVEFVSDDEPTPLRESYENRMAINVLDPLFPDDQQPYRVVIYDKRYPEDCVYAPGMYTLRIEPIKGPFASLAHAQDVYDRYSAIINEYAAHCVCQTSFNPRAPRGARRGANGDDAWMRFVWFLAVFSG